MYDKMVVEHFDKAIKSDYYSSVISRRKKYNDAVDEFVISHIKRNGYKTLLDAGCGTGSRALHYRATIPDLQIAGIDISPQMIHTARKNGLTETKCCSITSTEYADASFEVITCLFFVYCYLTKRSERLAAMRELYRILKPGGVMFMDCIMRHHKGENLEYQKNFKRALADFFCKSKKLMLPGDRTYIVHYPDGSVATNYFHAYSEHEMKRLIRTSGFYKYDERAFGYVTGCECHDKDRGQRVFVLMKPNLL